MRLSRTVADYTLTRWVFLRLIGLVYLAAFGSLVGQIPGLFGSRGILPASEFLSSAASALGDRRYELLPTLAWLRPGDPPLQAICLAGVALAVLLILDVLPALTLLLLWICYLSLVNVGQDFLSFQWDALLLEVGFLAIFLAPLRVLPRLGGTPPSRAIIWLFRLLLFRLMFFSGVVKLQSHDPTWRDLTAMAYHYQTQPLPTPLAWYMHQLPLQFQRASTAFVFITELVAPLFIWAPRRARFAGGALLAALQILIMATGNFAFFNLLSLALCVLLLDDPALRRVLPRRLRLRLPAGGAANPPPPERAWLLAPVVALVLLLNAIAFADLSPAGARVPGLARSVAGRVDPLHLVNSYGLFAVMTTERPEVVVEGSDDGTTWRAYEFRYKPGDPGRAPPVVAPFHPRLDWQMWFAALGTASDAPWFGNFMQRLLQGSPEVLTLLRSNPFPQAPPRYVRALLYDYRYTHTLGDGAWWQREPRGIYFRPASLSDR